MKPIEILRLHCIGRHDIENLRDEGFISKLRPFVEVSQNDFLEIINACQALYDEHQENVIDKDIIYQLNGCSHLIYNYALRTNSMLVKNKLINNEEHELLEKMFHVLMDCIEQLSNPHDRSENGMTPMYIYRISFEEGFAEKESEELIEYTNKKQT